MQPPPPSSVFPPPMMLPPTRPSRRLWWVLLAVAVLMAVVVGGVFVVHRSVQKAVNVPLNAFNANNPAEAVTKLDAVLANDPKNVTALIQKSLALAQEGSLGFKEVEFGSQAATAAEQAIAIDGSSSEAYRALGYANEIQQKYPEAHAAYEKAIALDPKNAAALFDEAHAYDLQGDTVKAKAGYEAALAVNPNSYGADLGLGRIASATGDATTSLAYFQKVYTYAPNIHDKAQAAYSVGMLLMSQNQFDAARGYLEKATTLDATYPSGWFGLGVVEYAQATASSTLAGNIRASTIIQSINALNTAIKLNPNQAIAHLQLAQDLYVIGQKPLALLAVAKAAAVVPSDITLSASEKVLLLKRIAAFKTFLGTTK